MKKYFNLFIILTLIATSLTNCKKSDSSTAKMQARVNNSLTICDSNVYVKKDLQNKLWGVSGNQKGGNNFNFTIPVLTVGTYQFLSFYSGTMCEAFYTKNYDFNNQYHSKNGSVTVTANTGKNIKGTFNFRATNFRSTDSVEVTEGSFDIDY